MAQSVVYADLKFATCPPSTVPDEDDSPYENVPLGPVTAAAPSPGGSPAAAAGTLGRGVVAGGPRPCLRVLLSCRALDPAMAHWQVNRSLRDTSREHMAEQGRLSQELWAREQSLEQTQLELAWARAELQRAWHEGNISQLELESRNAELGHMQEELAVLQEEVREVQGKLNASESTVSSLRACMNTDCCPRGWILFRSKCLYISLTKKTWQESQQDCAGRSARLLVRDNWSPVIPVPHFVQESKARYWIGARVLYETIRWTDSRHFRQSCWTVVSGEVWSLKCDELFQWICEKTPKLSSASE
ncbi:CD72 protein, partial [Erpornis zantholeuca]|nr:CD72 protein [Erpornis zantholeuca]